MKPPAIERGDVPQSAGWTRLHGRDVTIALRRRSHAPDIATNRFSPCAFIARPLIRR